MSDAFGNPTPSKQSTVDYITLVPADFSPINTKTGLNRQARLTAATLKEFQTAMMQQSAQINPPPPYGWVYFDISYFGLFNPVPKS